MMNWKIKKHAVFGSSLFLDNGTVELGIPLEYGLRIGHYSFCGGENVFFEQPEDMTDLRTAEGWRVRGGHRIWLAPERETVYYPDNEPIHYELLDNGVVITQKEDPWLHVRKCMHIAFCGGAEVEIVNRVDNIGDTPMDCSVWAISAMAPGGTQDISFALRDGGMDHWHRVSMWDYTSLGDPRAEYRRDGIRLRHKPLEERYKIGVGHPYGPVRYENRGVTFAKKFPIDLAAAYPDGNVSYETFMCRHMVEMESLSPMAVIEPGTGLEHTERWDLQK